MRFYNSISVDLFKLFSFSVNIKVKMNVDLCSYHILSCSISHLCTTTRHNNGEIKLFCRYSLRYCRVVALQKQQKNAGDSSYTHPTLPRRTTEASIRTKVLYGASFWIYITSLDFKLFISVDVLLVASEQSHLLV